jgi:hypothetical protein
LYFYGDRRFRRARKLKGPLAHRLSLTGLAFFYQILQKRLHYLRLFWQKLQHGGVLEPRVRAVHNKELEKTFRVNETFFCRSLKVQLTSSSGLQYL